MVRDGSESEIEARDLVPGDIIVLEEGKTIAADAKVSLKLDEKGRRRRRGDGRNGAARANAPTVPFYPGFHGRC